MEQCPPLLLDGVTVVTSGHSPGDIVNVSCRPGQTLSGASQLSCGLAANSQNQSVAVWDNREVLCSSKDI